MEAIFIMFWVILCYSIDMKLSEYPKRVGITYKTAYQWWRAGQLDAYQTPTGTVMSVIKRRIVGRSDKLPCMHGSLL